VGFVDKQLRLTTISSIFLMNNFNILVVSDEKYNETNSKKASAGAD
jgi:hypothetical protein